MEEELKTLLGGCASQQEAKAISEAYFREAEGKATILDSILLDRKRKETGAKKTARVKRQPAPTRVVQARPVVELSLDQHQFSSGYRAPITRYPLKPIEKTTLITRRPEAQPNNVAGNSDRSGVRNGGANESVASDVGRVSGDRAKDGPSSAAADTSHNNADGVRKRRRRRLRKTSSAQAHPSAGRKAVLMHSGARLTDGDGAGDGLPRATAAPSPSPPPVKRVRARPAIEGFPDYSDSESECQRPTAGKQTKVNVTDVDSGRRMPAESAGVPFSSAASPSAAGTPSGAGGTAPGLRASARPRFIDYGKLERESKRAALGAAFAQDVVDKAEDPARPGPAAHSFDSDVRRRRASAADYSDDSGGDDSPDDDEGDAPDDGDDDSTDGGEDISPDGGADDSPDEGNAKNVTVSVVAPTFAVEETRTSTRGLRKASHSLGVKEKAASSSPDERNEDSSDGANDGSSRNGTSSVSIHDTTASAASPSTRPAVHSAGAKVTNVHTVVDRESVMHKMSEVKLFDTDGSKGNLADAAEFSQSANYVRDDRPSELKPATKKKRRKSSQQDAHEGGKEEMLPPLKVISMHSVVERLSESEIGVKTSAEDYKKFSTRNDAGRTSRKPEGGKRRHFPAVDSRVHFSASDVESCTSARNDGAHPEPSNNPSFRKEMAHAGIGVPVLEDKVIDLKTRSPSPPSNTEPRKSDFDAPPASNKASLPPLSVLPDIIAKKTRFNEDSIPLATEKNGEAAAARSKRKKRRRRDLEAYIRALEQIVDGSLQYIIASTGERLGKEQPLTVAKAKKNVDQSEHGSKQLRPSVVKKFIDGKYSKRVDSFLATPP